MGVKIKQLYYKDEYDNNKLRTLVTDSIAVQSCDITYFINGSELKKEEDKCIKLSSPFDMNKIYCLEINNLVVGIEGAENINEESPLDYVVNVYICNEAYLENLNKNSDSQLRDAYYQKIGSIARTSTETITFKPYRDDFKCIYFALERKNLANQDAKETINDFSYSLNILNNILANEGNLIRVGLQGHPEITKFSLGGGIMKIGKRGFYETQKDLNIDGVYLVNYKPPLIIDYKILETDNNNEKKGGV